MNNSGKNQVQPGEGGKRPSPRSGPPRHGNHPKTSQGQSGRGQRDASTLGIRKEEPRKSLPVKDCTMCNKPIFDLAGAVADKDSGEPVHFECALERVAAAETLETGEKVVYLGAGCFGVVGFKNDTEGAFVVKRRIRWEKEGEKQPWRREISLYITKI
jgi:hypothetical protein